MAAKRDPVAKSNDVKAAHGSVESRLGQIARRNPRKSPPVPLAERKGLSHAPVKDQLDMFPDLPKGKR